MKNFTSVSVVLVASSLMLGCAGTGLGRSDTASATRGSMVVHGRSAKAVVRGPTVIHAYAIDRGGGLYTVPVVTGSDSDCGTVPPDGIGHATSIRPDQRMVLTVESGQMACLATSVTRNFELLWHAHNEANAQTPAAAQLALAARSDGVK